MGPSIAALIVISVLLTAVIVMFRATQIGSTLMANATRANAVRVADVANTSFEITSVSTTTDWYEQAEPVNPPNGYGCKPIVSGIERTGEVTAADPYQCYWFDGNDGESATIKVTRIFQGELFNRGASNKISLDLFDPSSGPTLGNTASGSYYFDSYASVHEKNFLLNRGSGKYRFKIWSIGQSSTDHGAYHVLFTKGSNPPLVSVGCVEYFQITNAGLKAFSDLTDMDVMASIGTTTMTLLTETSSAIPGLNEWSVTLPATTTVDGIVINNDVYEKGILNTGELLELRVKLAGYASESGTVTVVFPNGVNSTKTFDLLCNN